MSYGGSVHAAIISLKNNLGLRKGHSYFNKKKRLQRKVNPERMHLKKRSPKELRALAEQHYLRTKKVRQKQALFIGALFLVCSFLVWLVFF